MAAIPLMIGATLLALLSWFLTLHIFRTLDFYERGLKWRSPLRNGEVAFEGATRLDFKVTKPQDRNPLDNGIAEFSIYPARGKKFRWVGGNNNAFTNLPMTLTGVSVQSEDPMTIARDVMSLHVANTLEAQLAGGKEIAWTTSAALSSRGLKWWNSRTPIEWTQVESCRPDDQWCSIQIAGEAKPRKLRTSGPNFHPGLRLLLRQIDSAKSTNHTSTTPHSCGLPLSKPQI